MKVCVLAEVAHHRILPVTYELLTRALALAPTGEIGALVVSGGVPEEEYEKLGAAGADEIVAYEAPWLERFRPEPYAAALQAMVAEFKPEIVLGGATSTGRTWLPYAAMKLHTGLTADCTELGIEDGSGLLLQTRPAIGGNIMATIKTPQHRPQMATIRPRSTRPAVPRAGRSGQLCRRVAPSSWQESGLTELSFTPIDESQELSSAERVVVVGRGIKKPENLGLVRELARLLGAALGATREVVDRGWLPYSCQIGLSGRTITPELYVGVGVSGAIQHLAGMQTSQRIVAINTDSEAQIFSLADIGIVGNLLEVVPAMNARLRAGGAL